MFKCFWMKKEDSDSKVISRLIPGCQLSRFCGKLPEFEARFTCLRIFDEIPEFRQHSKF